jgi:hypothetical protein
MSRIEINVTGNHGCDRNANEGESLTPLCAQPNCVDCRAREFVANLISAGNCIDGSVLTGESGVPYEHKATLTHWPHDANGGIVDDLVKGVRLRNRF